MNPTSPQPSTSIHPSSSALAEPVPDCVRPSSDLQNLLNNGSYRVKEQRALIQCRTVEPAETHQPPLNSYVIASPPAATALLGKRQRNGKIACLPKLERDMVSKLLHNNVPYSKIVWALSERAITVTERNISNWRTRGGYKEWCAEQDNQLRLAHLQDHLTDYLRKHDAQQLPEVGLQVASTQLTSLLLNPQTAAPLLADPNKYARIVQALDTCSVRLNELQKERYKKLNRASIRGSIPDFQRNEATDVETVRKLASAEKVADYPHEDHVPHRNDLPPREVLPYPPVGPSFADFLAQMGMKKLAPNSQQRADAPANGNQPTPAGNQTVTHGNPR